MDITYEDYVSAVNALAEEIGEELEALTPEEFDALTEDELLELNRDNIVKYVRGAAKDLDRSHRSAKYIRAIGDKTKPETEDQARHFDKRVGRRFKGLGLANAKLRGDAKISVKEEAEVTNNEQSHENDLQELTGKGKLEQMAKKYKSDARVDEEHLDETVASDSIKANPSKADAMAHLLGHMNSMSKGEAIDFFQKVMAQFGPGKDFGVGDNSAKNSATIDTTLGAGPKTKDAMPTLSVKEDVEEMFAGQDLSEEFKDKVSTLFEAAVAARVIAEQAALEEAYAEALEEQVALIAEEVTDKLDAYLDYAVTNWMEENVVAVESALRNEVMEDFIGGLKTLFAEHYIEMPEEKVDVVEAMAEKIEVLESKLDEVIVENAELKGVLAEDAKNEVFDELAEDLALTQREKFAALAEGIEFDGDLEVYEKKLKIVKENYFKSAAPTVSNITEETFEPLTESTANQYVDPRVRNYASAIARTVKS